MNLPKKVHPSWAPILSPLLEDERWIELRRFLGGQRFLPQPAEAVFNAFDIELHRLRVVMCGQDPYPKANDAHGIAFSIPDSSRPYKQWPFSLQVIAKNICKSYDDAHIEANIEAYIEKWFSPNLESWMRQGVLLINKALTIGSQSHIPQWTWFTQGLISNISNLDRPIIFYFMGNPARALNCFVDTEKHRIFESIHPAALAYNPSLEFDGKFEEVAKACQEIHRINLLYTLPF